MEMKKLISAQFKNILCIKFTIDYAYTTNDTYILILMIMKE